MILFFLNILFFNFWEKSGVEREIIGENFGTMRCERKIVGENFEKRENMWEIKKKIIGEK